MASLRESKQKRRLMRPDGSVPYRSHTHAGGGASPIESRSASDAPSVPTPDGDVRSCNSAHKKFEWVGGMVLVGGPALRTDIPRARCRGQI